MIGRRRGEDFAAAMVPVVYNGCRCPRCMPSPPAPEAPPETVTIRREAVDQVIARAFGPMPDEPG
jgi:hypothetical protein